MTGVDSRKFNGGRLNAIRIVVGKRVNETGEDIQSLVDDKDSYQERRYMP